jgi:membrane fusion protein, heavy metal efflux system
MKSIISIVAISCGLVFIFILFSSTPSSTESNEQQVTTQNPHAHDDEHGSDHGSGHEDDEGHDHDNEAAHGDEHGDEHSKALKLSPAELTELDITLAVAGAGELAVNANLPGEVRLNEERLAHVVPNIAGVVRDVSASLGDTVEAGDIMAVLASRELAESKATHLAAHSQFELLELTFQREKQLWEDKVSAEQDYLKAKNARDRAGIDLRASEQQLYALGVSKEAIHQSTKESNSALTRFEVRAPFAGTVIEKHITLGEAVETTSSIFVIADLSTVWVDLSVYAKDLLLVRKGQTVIISSDSALPDIEGTISYIGPVVGEETRTALARVILPNVDGLWRPGMFVTAKVAVDEWTVPIKVPKTALLTIDGTTNMFIQSEDGFDVVEVHIGRVDQEGAEIISGLSVGQQYVATGGFYLKADLAKEAFSGDGHNH